MKKDPVLNQDIQLEIFKKVFLELIEVPSFRYKLKSMIDSRERAEQAELDLRLKKLELEIMQKDDFQAP